ncbi:MAG: hypothetical protein AAGN35_15295 [Bacteroidota bacterium]
MTLNRNSGILYRRLSVNYQGDRVGSSFLIPCDCERITGFEAIAHIGATALAQVKLLDWGNNQAGHITLRWEGIADVIYQDKVRIPRTYEQDFTPMPVYVDLGLNNSNFWHSGRRITPANLVIPDPGRVITVYYKDSINDTVKTNESYIVHLFLHYQKGTRP